MYNAVYMNKNNKILYGLCTQIYGRFYDSVQIAELDTS